MPTVNGTKSVLAEQIKDRLTLLEIVETLGKENAKFSAIHDEFWHATRKDLNVRTFQRYCKDIREWLGISIRCHVAGCSSTYYVYDGADYNQDPIGIATRNSFLLGNLISAERFPKDRVYIAYSYYNPFARIVAGAIEKGRNIQMRQKHLEEVYKDFGDNIFMPVSVKAVELEFEFIPYALSYTSSWYVFGKKRGEDELLVFSLENTISLDVSPVDYGDRPDEDFSLENVLRDFRSYFKFDKMKRPDDRLAFFGADRTSNFRLY